ncbi:MAG: hypothetical protein QOJ12_410 [Thermoleophilales bacterium]|nr:hypothetical protein [Thermoleophilales bacterium]
MAEKRVLGYIALGTLVSSLLLIVVIVIPVSYQSRDALIAIGFLGVVLLTTAFLRYSQTGGDCLDPLFLISLVFFFYFVLHGVWVVFNEQLLSASIPFPYSSHLAGAAVLVAVAFLSLIAGYFLIPSRKHRDGAPTILASVDRAPHGLLIALFVFGLLCNGAAAAAGGYSKTNVNVYNAGGNVLVFRTLGYAAYVAYVVAICQAYLYPPGRDRTRARRLAFGVMLPAQIAIAFAVGAKQEVVFTILPLLVAHNYLSGRIRARSLLATGLIFVFVVTPVIQASRVGPGNVSNNQFATGLGGIADTLTSVPKQLSVLTRPVDLLDGYNVIQRRTNGLESVALALRYTPNPNPYQHGRALAAVPLSLIPRFVWPNKPLYSPGKDFSVSYGGESEGRGYGLTIAPTYPGDLYINFGLVGVIVGSLLFGLGLRATANLLGTRRRGRSLPLVVYLIVIVPAMLVEQDIAAGINAVMLRLLVSGAFVYGLAVVTRRQSAGELSGAYQQSQPEQGAPAAAR